MEIKDEKIRFSKRALDKDPLDWFEENRKKTGDIITTRIHEVLKTGVKVSIDKDKKLIVTIKKSDLAKDASDQRPEVFSKDNALDAKIVELDIKNRRIKLSPNFKSHYLSWIPPLQNESLRNYVLRLSKYIKHENSVLIGVSFGGVIVQELSKILKIKKVIIISSVKSNKELSNSMKFAKKTKSYKLLPLTWLEDFESLLVFVLGPKIKRKVNLYRKYLSVRDENYLKWAIKEMVNWKQSIPLKNVIHIHGTYDLVFPVLNLKNYIPVERGDHTMILKRADWLNDYFLKNLD